MIGVLNHFVSYQMKDGFKEISLHLTVHDNVERDYGVYEFFEPGTTPRS